MKNLLTIITIIFLTVSAKADTFFNTNVLFNGECYETTPADSIIEISPVPIGPFCPKKLVAGDRDFNGRGPEIWATAKLTFSRSAVMATVQFRAKETAGGDNSETSGSTIKILYNAPRGFYITEIMSGKSAEVHFISKPGTLTFNSGGLAKALNSNVNPMITDKNDGLVSGWEITGDTNGQDISDDDNCDDDTRIKVILNKIKIKLRKTEAMMGIQTVKVEDINE